LLGSRSKLLPALVGGRGARILNFDDPSDADGPTATTLDVCYAVQYASVNAGVASSCRHVYEVRSTRALVLDQGAAM
jgi:hypothetical protein